MTDDQSTSCPMRFAYADPPYLGQGLKHYGDHPQAAVWDSLDAHRDLVSRMVDEFPDGWAISLSSPSLRVYLPWCPDDVRVAAWVKPFHAYKKGVRPAYSWEPVLFRGGRNKDHPAPAKGGEATTPKDFIAANITLRKGLAGAKPPEVCSWILDLLGFRTGDSVVDMFPGTGVMGDVVAAREGQPLQVGLFGGSA
jgi:hypothetical protein